MRTQYNREYQHAHTNPDLELLMAYLLVKIRVWVSEGGMNSHTGIPGVMCWANTIVQPNFILSLLLVTYEMKYIGILFAAGKPRIYK
jgi:hypothetical protein